MNYKQYFENKFNSKEQNSKNVNKDAVEDIKDFKKDYFQPLLACLKIKEEYNEYFVPTKEIGDLEKKFLDLFFTFITDDYEAGDNRNSSLTRGVGKKTSRGKGRNIINNNISPFYKELIPIYETFSEMLLKAGTNYNLDINPIYQEAYKVIKQRQISNEIKTILSNLENLNFSDFKQLILSLQNDFELLKNTLNLIFKRYTEKKDAVFISCDSNNPIEAVANYLFNFDLEKTDNAKNIERKIKQCENNALNRKNQSNINKLKSELNEEILNTNKENFEATFGLSSDNLKYDKNFKKDQKAQAIIAKDFYNSITEGIQDVCIHFNKKQN